MPDIKHGTLVDTNAFPDDGTSPVGSGEWNEAHTLIQATGRILGRVSANVGATEELTPEQVNTLLGGGGGGIESFLSKTVLDDDTAVEFTIATADENLFLFQSVTAMVSGADFKFSASIDNGANFNVNCEAGRYIPLNDYAFIVRANSTLVPLVTDVSDDSSSGRGVNVLCRFNRVDTEYPIMSFNGMSVASSNSGHIINGYVILKTTSPVTHVRFTLDSSSNFRKGRVIHTKKDYA